MSDDTHLLGVDVGTYSSKGVLVSLSGDVVASHVVEHSMSTPEPGWFEHDADAVWWNDFVQIVQALLGETGVAPRSIGGIGTSALGSCVLPIDESGKPLRPAILYGIDTRATGEIEYLSTITGRQFTSQDSGPKVRWIRVHEPEVYERSRWFLTSQAYLVFRLTGVPSIDIYTAGGYRPAYDAHSRRWVQEMAEHVAPIERFPRAYWSHEVVGTVTADAARETGLSEGTPVIAGTTDAAAEAISAGVSSVGDMMVMFGSSIFFILKTTDLVKTERFWASNFLEDGTFAFMGGMSTAGSLTRWFRDHFAQVELHEQETGGPDAYAALAELASGSPAGANGLVALPYFAGERTPLHDPDAKGAILGLTLRHTRGDVYRALLESVAYGIRHNIEAMREEGMDPRRILAVGGGTKNLPWLQMVSDIANIALDVPEQQIGASYGDAFMAAVGTGLYSNLSHVSQWVSMKHKIKPRTELRTIYDRNYEIFRELYPSTRQLMHRLTAVQSH